MSLSSQVGAALSADRWRPARSSGTYDIGAESQPRRTIGKTPIAVSLLRIFAMPASRSSFPAPFPPDS
jgi:hypothetical protein